MLLQRHGGNQLHGQFRNANHGHGPDRISTRVVDITVVAPGGTSSPSSTDKFTFETLPGVTAVNPTVGAIAGGYSVTITGFNLWGAAAVAFGTTAATSFTVNSATQITHATAPAGSERHRRCDHHHVGGDVASFERGQVHLCDLPEDFVGKPERGADGRRSNRRYLRDKFHRRFGGTPSAALRRPVSRSTRPRKSRPRPRRNRPEPSI